MSEQLTFGEVPKPSTNTRKKVGVSKKANAFDERLSRLAETKARIDQRPAVSVGDDQPTGMPEAPPFDVYDAHIKKEEPVKAAPPVIETPAIEEEPKKDEPEVLSISDLNKEIKKILESSYPIIWVKGEISNFKKPASGHMYFTLKDPKAQIRAIMFRGFAQNLKFRPEDGMEVLVQCKVTVYEPRGDYQLFCEVMEPVGFGALQVAFEKLKAQLQSEGLFDKTKKKPIPSFPSKIGIITSPTGAAIRDMLNVLGRRFGGGLDITVLPVAVQGEKAKGEIAHAIEVANRLGPERFDVLLVGRGGGSLEDLWAFNEEVVARAVAQSKIPTISCVGHEVDFTICDFVADLRAPTPSAAAELVVKNKADLLDRVKLVSRQMLQLMRKQLHLGRAQLDGASKRLVDPKRKLQDLMLRCDEWTERLTQGVARYLKENLSKVGLLKEQLGRPDRRLLLAQEKLANVEKRLEFASGKLVENKRQGFQSLVSMLNGLSPLAVLERGYSIVRKGEKVVKSPEDVATGDTLEIKLHKGKISSKVIDS